MYWLELAALNKRICCARTARTASDLWVFREGYCRCILARAGGVEQEGMLCQQCIVTPQQRETLLASGAIS